METIRVNMTPCEDIKTIHASQNDNEGREWGFELHNNGEKIDSSSISDQLVFKAYEGGTEEILPTNGSTPTTSPFLGDIRYPQGLLSDQEFLYRESPTEEDGLAKITDIKGNTLVWNQLVQNGNFADVSAWSNFGCSYTVSQGTATVKSNAVGNQFGIYQRLKKKANHAYFISFEMHMYGSISVRRNRFSSGQETLNEGLYQRIEVSSNDDTLGSAYQFCFGQNITNVDTDYFTLKNFMIVDLTQMGLDISSPSDFTSLFPLSYYSYNQGTLLSFMGNGIKTVGKNRFNKGTLTPNSRISANGDIFSSNASDLSDYVDVGAYDSVTVSYDYIALMSTNQRDFCFFDSNKNYLGVASYYPTNKTFTLNVQDCHYLRITFDKNVTDIQIEGGSKTSYEPYTESTLSLPISTYFSNGMDGVGTDYDELTNTKATTRMARVDLGTLGYTYEPQNTRFFTLALADVIKKPTTALPNIIVPNYTVNDVSVISAQNNMSVGVSRTSGAVFFSNASYTDATAFKTAMSGVYLVYPLATPIETSFTTASLVTENTEIPLSNEDGVLIGKCTEQLSAEPGFHDAKIKLADEDGECYSNKIQLHVERKPS